MKKLKEQLTVIYASRTGIRIASTTALLAYPLGCIAMLLLPGRLEWIGGVLLVMAAISFLYTLPSYLKRVALMPHVLRFVDKDCRLDELELELRRRAQAFAYKVLSVLVLIGIMYLVIAADLARDQKPGGIWMPTVDDHWLAVLFGALFYVLLLPLAYLAWNMPKPVLDDEPGDSLPDPESARTDAIVMTGMTVGLALGIAFFEDAILWMAIGTAVAFIIDRFLRGSRNGEES